MQSAIRKLSVGKDFPDKVIHYQVDKLIRLNSKPYIISDIILNRDMLEETGTSCFNIFIKSEIDNYTILWKSVIDMSVVVEYNINVE